ncbi:MAG TPA: helix-turn-helix domain-containing protein [Nocardioidaceae bacterium]|nr:helix-turn-helix domain-containing protein [Nocardioidaceae bacterium]
MARPRTITDDQLLSSAAEVLAEVGPSRFTLAKAATRAGVAPATYIKRFGTKLGLFLALNHRWVNTVAAGIDAAASKAAGVDRIRAAAMWGVAEMDVPEHAANMLAALALDLQHPSMTALLDQGWVTWRERVGTHVSDAIAAGDLPHAPAPPVAAQMLFALVEGTRLAWCVRPEGSLEHRVRQLIDELISTWSTPRSSGSG